MTGVQTCALTICYYSLNLDIRWIRAELPCEKNCLHRSSGVVGESLEPNVALRKYGKIKPPTLFFPLYCDNDYFQPNGKLMDINDLHVVYAGGVAGSHRDKAQYGMIQFHDLIRELSGQKIHFHIYPSPSNFSADFTEYRQIDAHNDYFHFHPASHDSVGTKRGFPENCAGSDSQKHHQVQPDANAPVEFKKPHFEL